MRVRHNLCNIARMDVKGFTGMQIMNQQRNTAMRSLGIFAATAALLQNRFEPLKAVGGIIGTSVSIFSRYLGRTITMSALLTIAIVGLWAGAVYEPTAITFLSREAGMAPPDAAKMASYGTGLLSVGTILGCIAAPWLAERLGRRPTLAL